MLEDLMNNPYAWAILALATIGSLIYAVYCQKVNKVKREFSYDRKTNTLIENSKSCFEKLAISYDGKPIKSLCVSKFVIWNSGNTVINASDVVETKEITLQSTENNQILESCILNESEKTNKFNVSMVDERTIKILFDYADQKDGIVLQVIHTGLRCELGISCKLKGGKPLKSFKSQFPSIPIFHRKKPKRILLIITLLTAVITYALFPIVFVLSVLEQFGIISSEFINYLNNEPEIYTNPIVTVIYGIIILALSIFMLIMILKIFKYEFCVGIPAKLKKSFLDEQEN